MPLTGDAAPTVPMRVTAIRYAAQDTNLYEFRRPDGAVLPPDSTRLPYRHPPAGRDAAPVFPDYRRR